MTTTLNALYYLNAWEADAEVEGSIAHRAMLKKCQLDYSITSLRRIDAFIDAIRIICKPSRDDFLQAPENQNLFYLMAFYVGEVIGRALGSPPIWLSYDDATAITPDHERMFSRCFETSVCCRFLDSDVPSVDFFTPLYALVSRLLDAGSGKSIWTSAGLCLPLGDGSSTAQGIPTPPLTPGLLGTGCSGFVPPDTEARLQYQLIRPYWGNGHPIQPVLDHADHLLKTGRIVWGTVVRANHTMFNPEYRIGAPGDVIYDPMGRVPPEDLHAIGRRIFALKDAEQHDEEFAALKAHMVDELHAAFGMPVLLGMHAQPLMLSSTYFDQLFLPDGMLSMHSLPLLVSDELPGMALPLPWQLWPADLIELWRSTSESTLGYRVDTRDWKKKYDDAVKEETARRTAARNAEAAVSLYEEGLLHYHGRGVGQDFEKARRLWEQAAELGDTNAQNNLGIVFELGQGVAPDLQRAVAYYRQAAEGGNVLAQLNMGKTHLREPGSGITPAEAKQWLQMAARQGSDEAVALLLHHFR